MNKPEFLIITSNEKKFSLNKNLVDTLKAEGYKISKYIDFVNAEGNYDEIYSYWIEGNVVKIKNLLANFNHNFIIKFGFIAKPNR